MLARVQRLIVLALSLLMLASVIAAVALGPPIYAAFTPLVLGAYLSVLASEFGLLWLSYDRDDALRPTLFQLMRAWAAEVVAAPRAFLWRQPFRALEVPDNLSPTSQGRRGVLLIHGFFCNRGLWNPWLRRLREADTPFIAVSLEPVFGSIDDYAQIISEASARLQRATSLAPVIVAHSMGGLAVRKWLATDASVAPVHRVVTIATPHSGTKMAGRTGAANIAQMRLSSPWLGELAVQETSSYSQFTCFWSHCDNIVFPTRNATLPGADNRHLEATPHVQMVFHPAIFDEVLRLVAAVPAAERTAHADSGLP